MGWKPCRSEAPPPALLSQVNTNTHQTRGRRDPAGFRQKSRNDVQSCQLGYSTIMSIRIDAVVLAVLAAVFSVLTVLDWFVQEASVGAVRESSASGSASCPSKQQAPPPLFLPGISVCGRRSEFTFVSPSTLIGPPTHSRIVSLQLTLVLTPVLCLCLLLWSR